MRPRGTVEARSGIREIVCIHHDEEKLLTLRCNHDMRLWSPHVIPLVIRWSAYNHPMVSPFNLLRRFTQVSNAKGSLGYPLAERCDLEVMSRPGVEIGRLSAFAMMRKSC